MGGLRRWSIVINGHDDVPNLLQLVFHFKEVPLKSSARSRSSDVSTLLHHSLEFNYKTIVSSLVIIKNVNKLASMYAYQIATDITIVITVQNQYIMLVRYN